MKCPICEVDLLMTNRKEVEIDYCPKCRGIWLDRGELDKIIERSVTDIQPGYNSGNVREYDDDDDHERGYHDQGENKNRKKRSLLSDLFDF